MRRILLTVLLTTVLAPLAWAQDCKWCELSIEPGNKVQWGGKYNFCSEGCRREWYLDTRYRCKICNDKVEPKSSGGTRHVGGGITIIQITPGTWDGYCDFCREGVKNGTIDPAKDRYVPPKDDGGIAAQINAPAPSAEPANPFADVDTEDDDDTSYLKWILGAVVGLIFLIAKLLR